MKSNSDIKASLGKYADGKTSCEEEETLRRHFAKHGKSLPEEMLPYKALFAYVDAERRQTAAPRAKARTAAATRLKRIATAAAAAAAIIVAVTIWHKPPVNYAVIDGKVYTDSRTVNAEALDALQMVSSDYGDTFDALDIMK